MESAFLGLVLDSSVLVAAERKNLTTPEAIREVREAAGDVSIVICSMTVAEPRHPSLPGYFPQWAFGFTAYTLLKVLAGKFRQVNWFVYLLTILFLIRFAYVG